MSAQKTVSLPKHLWVALDEMSRDGATKASALMEQAVEQFVALQGYDVPPSAPAADPSSLFEDEELAFARTQARSALTPALTAQPTAPVATAPVAAHPVGAQPPNITDVGPTQIPAKGHVGLAAVQAAAPTEVKPAQVPGPPGPSAAPPPSAPKAKLAPAPPAPEPLWVKRPALSDADEERAAARERLASIDADVAKLTIERPTTVPLGQAAAEDGDGE